MMVTELYKNFDALLGPYVYSVHLQYLHVVLQKTLLLLYCFHYNYKTKNY